MTLIRWCPLRRVRHAIFQLPALRRGDHAAGAPLRAPRGAPRVAGAERWALHAIDEARHVAFDDPMLRRARLPQPWQRLVERLTSPCAIASLLLNLNEIWAARRLGVPVGYHELPALVRSRARRSSAAYSGSCSARAKTTRAESMNTPYRSEPITSLEAWMIGQAPRAAPAPPRRRVRPRRADRARRDAQRYSRAVRPVTLQPFLVKARRSRCAPPGANRIAFRRFPFGRRIVRFRDVDVTVPVTAIDGADRHLHGHGALGRREVGRGDPGRARRCSATSRRRRRISPRCAASSARRASSRRCPLADVAQPRLLPAERGHPRHHHAAGAPGSHFFPVGPSSGVRHRRRRRSGRRPRRCTRRAACSTPRSASTTTCSGGPGTPWPRLPRSRRELLVRPERAPRIARWRPVGVLHAECQQQEDQPCNRTTA